MGLFSKKEPPTQPPRPSSRTIPVLDPDYFESIHQRLVANGGSDSSTEIAYGVGNAIFNVSIKALNASYASRQAKDFEALFADRSPEDRAAADGMIDFMVTWDPSIQSGEGGFLGSLVARLDDVLSRPA